MPAPDQSLPVAEYAPCRVCKGPCHWADAAQLGACAACAIGDVDAVPQKSAIVDRDESHAPPVGLVGDTIADD